MKRPVKRAAGFGARLIPLLVLPAFVLGCKGILLMYKGRTVSEQARIALPHGEGQAGLWQAPDLTLKYSCDLRREQLKISGEIRFSSHVKSSTGRIECFRLLAMFLDESGKVLETKVIAGGGYYTPSREVLSFVKDLHLPEATTAMAFSYTGTTCAKCDSASFFYYPPLQ